MMMSLIIIPVFAIIYLRLSKFYQFVVLTFSSLLPFSLGDFRSIPNFQLIEWIPFVTLLILVNDLIPINRIEKNTKIIRFKGIGIFVFAMIILIIWTLVSYFGNEVLTKSIVSVNNAGTTRLYFNIFNNILLFFVVIIFVAVYFESINFEKFFKILLYGSLVLGFLRLASYFWDFNLPFLTGEFVYGGEYSSPYSKLKYGGTAYRLGGLTDVVSFGIPALFSYYLFKKKFNFMAMILLFFLLFLSGGRTVMVGVFFAVIVFSFFFFPRNFAYLIVGGIVFIFIAIVIIPENVLQGQLGRFTIFNAQSSMGIDTGRALGWKLLWESFLSNPVWGKGIGHYDPSFYLGNSKYAEFVKQISFAGGHGSYLSLLSLYGLGGITYFLIMIVGGIALSIKKINEYVNLNLDKTAIAVFGFMILIIKMFDYITAKNGLDVTIIFYSVGFLASLTVIKNKELLQ